MMGMVAEKNGLDVKGAKATVQTEMTSVPANRIRAFTVTIALPRRFSEEDQLKLRKGMERCPVHNSFHPDMEIRVVMVSPR